MYLDANLKFSYDEGSSDGRLKIHQDKNSHSEYITINGGNVITYETTGDWSEVTFGLHSGLGHIPNFKI